MKFCLVFFLSITALAQNPIQAPKPGAEENIKSDFAPLKDQTEEGRHSPIRKIVVFPFEAPNKEANVAEKAWWKIREELTANKRFLIASKQLMQRKDVFLPKKEIDRASAILLGKHLDADALVTASLRDRDLKMSVYSAATGALLWTQEIKMSTAAPLSEQIESVSLKLVRDFVAQIPYQGFQILDPLIGKSVFDEGSTKRAKVEIASDARIESGDLVQWITVRENTPVYQSLNNLLIVAEGNVVKIERGIVTVEIKRLKDQKLLAERSLVRFPKEVTRMQDTMSLKVNTTGISPEIVVAEMRAAQADNHEFKGAVTTGATLGSILGLILLAF